MPDRYRAPGGWTVDVITLSGTPDHRDGEWLRVSFHGVHVADVRTVAELEQWFSLATLEETLALAPQALPPRPRIQGLIHCCDLPHWHEAGLKGSLRDRHRRFAASAGGRRRRGIDWLAAVLGCAVIAPPSCGRSAARTARLPA